MLYSKLKKEELLALKTELCNQYEKVCKKGLRLDMSRGKPSSEQLDLSEGILGILKNGRDCMGYGNLDTRNYGILDGITEAKKLFAELLEVDEKNILIGGASSLNLMYDEIARAMLFGVAGGEKPWVAQGEIKFLCPVPGYDRHFGICELMGIKMVNIPMDDNGPDMDMVEDLIVSDESIKGIWCVPKYSNPSGIVYSDEVVRRFASLKPKAKDFRIFWDNAYAVHDLYEQVPLANLLAIAKENGNENLPLIFASTSKITFSGAGICALAASEANLVRTKKAMGIQTIGFDKINQLRHAKYFENAVAVKCHMARHAESLRPKFEAVIHAFERELLPYGIAKWSNPKGGYFISLDLLVGSAKKVYDLAKNAGVILTPAGAPFPYGVDPNDQNLRIAPSFPPVSELNDAVEVLCLCVKLAAIDMLLT